MLTIICASLLASASLPATTQAAAAETALFQRPLLGGFNNVDVNDAGVQAAAAFAAQSVDAELGEVTSAQRQSAAGSNYRISFTTSDGRSYNAVVRNDLQGQLSVTSIEETSTDTGSNESSEGGDEE